MLLLLRVEEENLKILIFCEIFLTHHHHQHNKHELQTFTSPHCVRLKAIKWTLSNALARLTCQHWNYENEEFFPLRNRVYASGDECWATANIQMNVALSLLATLIWFNSLHRRYHLLFILVLDPAHINGTHSLLLSSSLLKLTGSENYVNLLSRLVMNGF